MEKVNALKILRELHNKALFSERTALETFVPELKESEDERIRRDIIRYLKKTSPAIGENIEKMLAWLEKQGEFYTKRDVDNAYIEGMAFAKDELEKQGEQKPIDKVEPKFHKGEWIVWKDKCYKVNYNGCGYELVDQDGLSTSLEYGTIDENAHIWDVTTDAKDGDVLISRYNKPFIYNGNWNSLNIGSYCGITTEGMFNVATEKCYWTGNVNIHPATKEERDLLFLKMHEAGYEWDAEKKELKKIEQKPVIEMKSVEESLGIDSDTYNKIVDECIYGEQKPADNEMIEILRTEYEKGRADAITEFQKAWSEEDESYLNTTIAYLKDAKEFKKTADNCIDWLKSLKKRYTWKPSDEQLEALKNAIQIKPFENPSDSLLWGLYEQLKKL